MWAHFGLDRTWNAHKIQSGARTGAAQSDVFSLGWRAGFHGPWNGDSSGSRVRSGRDDGDGKPAAVSSPAAPTPPTVSPTYRTGKFLFLTLDSSPFARRLVIPI